MYMNILVILKIILYIERYQTFCQDFPLSRLNCESERKIIFCYMRGRNGCVGLKLKVS